MKSYVVHSPTSIGFVGRRLDMCHAYAASSSLNSCEWIMWPMNWSSVVSGVLQSLQITNEAVIIRSHTVISSLN